MQLTLLLLLLLLLLASSQTLDDEEPVDPEDLEEVSKYNWNFPHHSVAARDGVAMKLKVALVAAGKGHTLMVTSRRELWSVGRNSEGQVCSGGTVSRNNDKH